MSVCVRSPIDSDTKVGHDYRLTGCCCEIGPAKKEKITTLVNALLRAEVSAKPLSPGEPVSFFSKGVIWVSARGDLSTQPVISMQLEELGELSGGLAAIQIYCADFKEKEQAEEHTPRAM